MKKIISLSLALILTLSLGAALVACDEHECEFKEEWASNDTHHWHECKGENCLEVADKGEHDWDEGTVNEEASTETTEELTYTCKTCGAVKGESVELEGAVEEAEWEAAVAEQKFDNVTINYTFNTENEDNQVHVVKITENKVFRSAATTLANGESQSWDYTFEGEEATEQRDMFLAIFLSLLAEKENFVYDPELKAYKMPEEVQTKLDRDYGHYVLETMRDGVVTFDAKGNVTSFVFWISEASYDENNVLKNDTRGTITLSFSDYGTTVVE